MAFTTITTIKPSNHIATVEKTDKVGLDTTMDSIHPNPPYCT
jgi:hypothetical protein